ncbi:MAG: CBS domain-containing protein [Chloroflexi bacterium]|nr:CBS domain-containing protein [Chloroflexota bacterium]
MPQTKRLGDTTERISRRDLQSERIRALGRHDAVAVDAGTPISQVIRQMQSAASTSRGAAIVTREGRLAGIVTERDVLLKVLGRDVDPSGPVEGIMTADPETLTADGSLREALAMMEHGHYRHIPIVEDDGAVVGILSQQDVLEYVAEAFPQEILNLPPRPHQKMEKEEGG